VIHKFIEVSYLNEFQKRLSCGTNRRQQGDVEVIGKHLQSFRSYGQAFCNVFQSSLSGSGFGGHLVRSMVDGRCLDLKLRISSSLIDFIGYSPSLDLLHIIKDMMHTVYMLVIPQNEAGADSP
jgi:hypothetical protein